MDPAALAPILSVFGNISMFVGGVAVTVWVLKSMKDGKGHDGNPGSWAELLKQLQSISSSLSLTAERLANLPTRAEVMGELRANVRYDIGDEVQPVVGGLDSLERSVDALAAEIRQKR